MFRNMLMALGGLALLWIGSCSVMTYGAAVAVKQAANTGSKYNKSRELREHNEEMNREAARNVRERDSDYDYEPSNY